MGTIVARCRSDGTIGYTAQIKRKKGGEVIYSEARTFDRRPAAAAWLARREAELAEPGAMERKDDPALSAVIDRYIAESRKAIGRTKAQVLAAIKASDLGEMRCSQIKSEHIVAYARGLNVQPQTKQNYLSHLSAVFTIAKPAWGYPLDPEAMRSAMVVAKKLGETSKSRERDRRPTLDELNRLLDHFGSIRAKRPASIPMQEIVLFALFSTRRQEEITRIARGDFDAPHTRILVRDMKHPGDKAGNDTWCQLTPEAIAILKRQPKHNALFFPYSPDAISAAFTRACKFLEIQDLHFHDLRHEGISWLFEKGWTIPQAAGVSAHRTWQSLKRYTQIHETGDKYAGWKWRPK